ATRLITTSEDDSSPVIMLRDLRNARASEKIFSGHERGVFSLSCSTWGPNLSLSCGKDNRTICWNPTSVEIVGRNPRNPGMSATANYDGSSLYPIYLSLFYRQPLCVRQQIQTTPANFADTNDAQNLGAGLSLEKALKVPVGARFGFGGRLVQVHKSTGIREEEEEQVAIQRVVGEEGVIKRTKELIEAEKTEGGMKAFVEERANAAESGSTNKKEPSATDKPAIADKQGWSALLTVFGAEPKDTTLLLLRWTKLSRQCEPRLGEEPTRCRGRREGEEGDSEAGTGVPGAAPSEVNAFRSDAMPVDPASTATEPSLFRDEPIGGGAAGLAAGDFFNTLASGDPDASTIRLRAKQS
ncbi:protein transport protein S31, partial [Ceratobasidium sp. 414]